MPQRFRDSQLLEALGSLCSAAGLRIMSHYGASATLKADGSPVTAADNEAEEIILEGLHSLLPGVPVLAEESAAAGRFPATTDLLIAVDPLDGTREFLAGNGEFTVNIGLISAGRPVGGLLYAPARSRLWIGHGDRAEAMGLAAGEPIARAEGRAAIRTRPLPADGAVALVSRSHPEPAGEAYLAAHHVTGRLPMGSSLKFGVIAEGGADVTVRFASLAEWDIAAGHSVLESAGGRVTMPDGSPLTYGRAAKGFRCDAFVAASGDFPAA